MEGHEQEQEGEETASILPPEFPRRDVGPREAVLAQRREEAQARYQQERETLAELAPLPGASLRSPSEDGDVLASELEDIVVRSCFVDISRWRALQARASSLRGGVCVLFLFSPSFLGGWRTATRKNGGAACIACWRRRTERQRKWHSIGPTQWNPSSGGVHLGR